MTVRARMAQWALTIVGLLVLVTTLAAQSRPAPRFKPNPLLTEQEKMGEHWFLQRCSLCHLAVFGKDDPAAGSPVAGGPSLEGLLKESGPDREQAVRDVIMNGTATMPGFQHGLEPRKLDELIAYLKTL